MNIAYIFGSMARPLNGIDQHSSQYFASDMGAVQTPIPPKENPFGVPSSAIYSVKNKTSYLYYLFRHGENHRSILPHNINSRANIYALYRLGVEAIISFNAVGSMCEEIPPGCHVLPSQFIDYTWGREHTFYSADSLPDDFPESPHVDFTVPVNMSVLNHWLTLLKAIDGPHCARTDIVCGVTQGPRLESSAEIARLRQDGCHLVNMTMLPEAALARECSMAYVAHAFACNWSAGYRSDQKIDIDACSILAGKGLTQAKQIMKQFWTQAQHHNDFT